MMIIFLFKICFKIFLLKYIRDAPDDISENRKRSTCHFPIGLGKVTCESSCRRHDERWERGFPSSEKGLCNALKHGLSTPTRIGVSACIPGTTVEQHEPDTEGVRDSGKKER